MVDLKMTGNAHKPGHGGDTDSKRDREGEGDRHACAFKSVLGLPEK